MNKYTISLTQNSIRNSGTIIKKWSCYSIILGLAGFMLGEFVTQKATDPHCFSGGDDMAFQFKNGWNENRQKGG